MLSLSIVIPAYNEERRLPQILDRIREFIERRKFHFVEIIVVDDGSRDGTAIVVREAASTDSRVRLVSNPGNRGKGYAVRHGMQESRGDWVEVGTVHTDLSAPRILVPVPPRFGEMQQQATDAAVAWRLASREAFTHYFGRGYRAVGFVRGDAGGGNYVLKMGKGR